MGVFESFGGLPLNFQFHVVYLRVCRMGLSKCNALVTLLVILVGFTAPRSDARTHPRPTATSRGRQKYAGAEGEAVRNTSAHPVHLGGGFDRRKPAIDQHPQPR